MPERKKPLTITRKPAHGTRAKRSAAPFQVVFVEHPDPSGQRWEAALDLLIEAGKGADANSTHRRRVQTRL